MSNRPSRISCICASILQKTRIKNYRILITQHTLRVYLQYGYRLLTGIMTFFSNKANKAGTETNGIGNILPVPVLYVSVGGTGTYRYGGIIF
jgi:hypothetical protein